MDERRGGKTPCNSAYDNLMSINARVAKQKLEQSQADANFATLSELGHVCCKHGELCVLGKNEQSQSLKEDSAGSGYVNLADAQREAKAVAPAETTVGTVFGAELARQLRDIKLKKSSSSPLRAPKSERNIRNAAKSPDEKRRKKKKQRAHVDFSDSSSFDVVDPMSTSTSCSRKTVPRKKESTFQSLKDLMEPRRVNASTPKRHSEDGKPKDLASVLYIGVRGSAEAENFVKRKGEFRLYHHLSTMPHVDDLEEDLKLYFVLRSLPGFYKHYEVKSRKRHGRTVLYIESGDVNVRYANDLNELVNVYREYMSTPGTPNETC